MSLSRVSSRAEPIWPSPNLDDLPTPMMHTGAIFKT